MLGVDAATLKEIEEAYKEIADKKLKGGYIRAVLKILYDERYQAEFNALTSGFLKDAFGKKENSKFSIVLSFINIALDVFSRKDYTDYSMMSRKSF